MKITTILKMSAVTLVAISFAVPAMSAEGTEEPYKIGNLIEIGEKAVHRSFQEWCYKGTIWVEYEKGRRGSFTQRLDNDEKPGKPIPCQNK